MLCYVMLCYVMLCYVMLCYVMLCQVRLGQVRLGQFRLGQVRLLSFTVCYITSTSCYPEFQELAKKTIIFFCVLLAVHLGTVLVNNQLDSQFFFLICLFLFSACFEQSCGNHEESQLYQYDIWNMSLYIGDRLVCRHTCIPDVTYTRCRTDTIDSPDDEHMAVRNMQRTAINIQGKRTVRQVGYLQGLCRSVRSAEHKI